jgi:hypothetical protein
MGALQAWDVYGVIMLRALGRARPGNYELESVCAPAEIHLALPNFQNPPRHIPLVRRQSMVELVSSMRAIIEEDPLWATSLEGSTSRPSLYWMKSCTIQMGVTQAM